MYNTIAAEHRRSQSFARYSREKEMTETNTPPYIPDPKMGKTVQVAIWMVQGEIDDVMVFTTFRPALKYVRDLLDESGDKDNWVEKLLDDGYFMFSHKTLNEHIVISHCHIQG